MPTIGVDKEHLYEALERTYTTQEFDELCFEFGIELDEDTTDHPRQPGERPELKIEIPANRYDMLCFEGIAMNLRVFLGKQDLPNFQLKSPAGGELQSITVKPETAQVRPYVSGVILRDITFTQERYDSFISLQDKLHMNLARQRTLVSIGTHDLDTVKGPFTYEALPPDEINFAPLNQTTKQSGRQIVDYYLKDRHMARYAKIIADSPVYPVIFDANRTVCSLPPLINGDHSKITLNTKNVFIEITAIDRTKLEIINHILVAMFSPYCGDKYTAEPIKIISPHNNETRQTPDLTPRATQAEVSYINSCCGLGLSPQEICDRLKRMAYTATPSKGNPDILDVNVPVTRADVLHQCDIMEDVAISYGFNRLPRTYPNKTMTIGHPLPSNKLADIFRYEATMCNFTEVLPLILCSHDENFAWLRRKDDGTTCVRLQNPKTAEYQIVRTSLVPGLLKSLRENRGHATPMKIFEVSDVVFKEPSSERKSRNEKHFAAAWYGKTSGFETIHALLDRVLLNIDIEALPKAIRESDSKKEGYWLEELDEPMYLDNRAASIMLRLEGKTSKIGSMGVLHPQVLDNFSLPFPCSTVEFNIEPFL